MEHQGSYFCIHYSSSYGFLEAFEGDVVGCFGSPRKRQVLGPVTEEKSTVLSVLGGTHVKIPS